MRSDHPSVEPVALSDPSPTNPPEVADVVLSQEELVVSRAVRVSGAVRLRKQVSVEDVTHTVQVRREHLAVDTLDAADVTFRHTIDDDATTPAELTEDEFDIVLHEERIVVTTQVVPVERIRVRRRITTQAVEVSGAVRAEQVGIETDQSPPSLPPDH